MAEHLGPPGLDGLVAEVGCPIQGLGLENAELKHSRSKLGVGGHGGLIDVGDPCGLGGCRQIRLLDSGITDMRYVGQRCCFKLRLEIRFGVLRMSVPRMHTNDWIHQQILMTEYPPLSQAHLSAL